MLGARVEVRDLHLHRLHFEVLRGDAGHLVSDLVALDGDVLALDAESRAKRRSHAKTPSETAATLSSRSSGLQQNQAFGIFLDFISTNIM